MKTRTKVTIAASLAILLASLGTAGAIQAHSEKGERWGGSSHGMGQSMGSGQGMSHGMGMGMGMMGKGQHGGRGMMKMFNSFDGNSDGAVTQTEIDQARMARLVSFDTDGDGSLSLKEYESLWLDAAREHMVDRFQNLDADGDGVLTKAEFSGPFSGMVKFMDRNGDGALSRDDMGRHGRMMKRDDDDD